MLNLKVLSKRKEINAGIESVCYLCEGKLENYVQTIPLRYTEYDIQRGIVGNVYLDRLTETILENKFIPPMVLIADEFKIDGDALTVENYKILDGLQRTYRIKAIYAALQLFISEIENKKVLENESKFKLSKVYKAELEEHGSNVTVFWTIVRSYYDKKRKLEDLKSIFSNFIQWFEVWSSLDKKEQINKMLVLNAGHKPMDIKHQLELLFLNIISIDYLDSFTRAKDVNSSFFYKSKKAGQLHLAHFISAIIAFNYKKPITVDAKFVRDLQDDLDQKLEELKFYFEDNNLELFINFIKTLDYVFEAQYPDSGISWLGRETVLIGLFAAFGKYYVDRHQNLEDCLKDIENKIKSNITMFKITEFNDSKSGSIDFTKANIGDVFKSTVFLVVSDLLFTNKTNVDWKILFEKKSKKVD